jgi:hypothetical protein
VGLLKDDATRLHLVATGGTDYHGDLETYAEAQAQLFFPEPAEGAFRSAVVASRQDVSRMARP